ncbi:MAG: hypothetical protein JWM80_4275 [Cyanobacteria bacterium RYN_339]|nr:hypothetical protein [Cyanobacteria bacterium RYN_339]
MVTAIILNWNGLAATQRCLAALGGQARAIVVDNGSTDGSAEQLPGALKLAENLGFAGGMNHGLALVQDPYVLLLNNDAELAPDAVEKLVAALEADPTAAAAAPTIYHGHPPDRAQVWFAGGTLSRRTATVHHQLRPDAGTHAVSYLSACCLLLRREALAAVGGLPEGYFMYFEDAELCDRLAAAGHRLLWVGAAEAWHAGGASTGSEQAKAPALDYYDVRNSLLFARRRRLGPLPWLYLFAVRLPRKLARIALGRQWSSLPAVWRGLLDGLAGHEGPQP